MKQWTLNISNILLTNLYTNKYNIIYRYDQLLPTHVDESSEAFDNAVVPGSKPGGGHGLYA